MVADFKVFAIFATLAFVWIPLVRGDSSDFKCYDSDGWKTLGSQKEVSCPNGNCLGFWTAEPGKDEKKGILMCEPSRETRNKFTTSDWEEYRKKIDSIDKNQETSFGDLLTTIDKISASGSSNGFPIPGININGKGTGYIKDILIGYVIAGNKYKPFSEKRKVKLEIDANVGAVEFQVKLDQEVQFDKDSQRGDIKINKKIFDVGNICIGQPQVCTGRRGWNPEGFEKSALKEFGSNKEVTLTWGKEISFRITGNVQPLVEKTPKVMKAISENKGSSGVKALKNAIAEIIGDITLVAKANVEIDDSTSAEVNINGNINEILNQIFRSPGEVEPTLEYAVKICTEKKCLHKGECTKNLCNHPEDLVKMANSAEGVKLSIVFVALNLLFLTKLY